MMTKLKTIVLTCLLFTVMSSYAHAETVQLRDSANSSGVYLSGTYVRELRYKINNGSTHTIGTGTFEFEVQTAGSSDWDTTYAYCLNYNQGIPVNTNPGDTVGITSNLIGISDYSALTTADADFLGTLWYNAFDLSTQSTVAAAAFQALVWEVMNDDSYSLDGGVFETYYHNSQFTADAEELAESWMDNIESDLWSGSSDLSVLVNRHGQDYLASSTSVVPEPSSMALALVGGIMLLGRGRRKNRIV